MSSAWDIELEINEREPSNGKVKYSDIYCEKTRETARVSDETNRE